MPVLNSKSSLSLLATLGMIAACGGESTPATAAKPAEETAQTEELVADVATSVESAFPTAALIDPNAATEEELAGVSGMTDAAAAAIVAGRPFATPTQMDAAIGDALDGEGRRAVYARVFIKVGLNSGAEDDYKLIPSTLRPGHLAHEFEEYRPFESMEQFSREMSKYVSDEEVVYLTRFVTLD